MVLFLLMLGALSVGTLSGYFYASSKAVRKTVSAVWQYRGLDVAQAFPGQSSVTVLLLGSDENRDNQKRIYTKRTRSDTIMLAHFDFVNRRISVLSIPRDTRVRIPEHGTHKINSAMALGGPELTVETIREWLEVPVDHYVVIYYSVFRRAVDLLGGITLYVDKPLHYDDNWGDLHVHLEPGWHHLNGEQALGYVRIRNVDSDLGRIERQQKFLAAVKEHFRHPSTYLKLPQLLDAVDENLHSSLSYGQMLALAWFAKSVPSSNIQMATLPCRPGRVYVYADEEKARELVDRLFRDTSARHVTAPLPVGTIQ
ncbi:MAG: transcriptional regulator [Armatimonadota bacterium]|nr:MAG: transcriptional regulator [Armatimonadota bacterium]